MARFIVAGIFQDVEDVTGADRIVIDTRSKVVVCFTKTTGWAAKICRLLNGAEDVQAAEPIKADRYKEGAEKAIEEGRCCQYCVDSESDACPIKQASPWSRWSNYCNLFSPRRGEDE